MGSTEDETLSYTPLNDLHVALGARMVPFAGYSMPVQYPKGILAEHLHTRAEAGLFDVSHMGQVQLRGGDPIAALEALLPADLQGLDQGRIRYSYFTNASGGILDDLMITRVADGLDLVVNAGCKQADIALMKAAMEPKTQVSYLGDRALLALQGPKAAAVMARHIPGAASMAFMSLGTGVIAGVAVTLTRSGYTGEDGYEISMAGEAAEKVARALLGEAEVEAIGLGARDSLRLEAGLPLYGHDIDETTSPIEAGLAWAIGKRRREGGGFPGAARIQKELADGPARRRVGLKPEGRAPMREGVIIKNMDGRAIGTITSGGFGPSVGGPVAMGYVESAFAMAGAKLSGEVRGKDLALEVVKLPFVPAGFYRG